VAEGEGPIQIPGKPRIQLSPCLRHLRPQCPASRSACRSGSIETPPASTAMASGQLRLQRSRSEAAHRASDIASAAVGVRMELGVADPMPALNAPPISRQFQQGFWDRSQAGEKEVFGNQWPAVTGSCGDDCNDPACAKPYLTDMLGRLHRLSEDRATRPGTSSVTGCSSNRPHPSRSTDRPEDNDRESFRPTEGQLQGSACATVQSTALTSSPVACIRDEGL